MDSSSQRPPRIAAVAACVALMAMGPMAAGQDAASGAVVMTAGSWSLPSPVGAMAFRIELQPPVAEQRGPVAAAVAEARAGWSGMEASVHLEAARAAGSGGTTGVHGAATLAFEGGVLVPLVAAELRAEVEGQAPSAFCVGPALLADLGGHVVVGGAMISTEPREIAVSVLYAIPLGATR